MDQKVCDNTFPKVGAAAFLHLAQKRMHVPTDHNFDSHEKYRQMQALDQHLT